MTSPSVNLKINQEIHTLVRTVSALKNLRVPMQAQKHIDKGIADTVKRIANLERLLHLAMTDQLSNLQQTQILNNIFTIKG